MLTAAAARESSISYFSASSVLRLDRSFAGNICYFIVPLLCAFFIFHISGF
jgi:hypothetical protein